MDDAGRQELRRLKLVAIDPNLILDFIFMPGKRVLEITRYALPNDATIFGVGKSPFIYDPETAMILLVVHSKEFDIVPEGRVIPYWPNPSIKVLKRRNSQDEICLECGSNLEDRRTLEGAGYFICENPQCLTQIPAFAWKWPLAQEA